MPTNPLSNPAFRFPSPPALALRTPSLHHTQPHQPAYTASNARNEHVVRQPRQQPGYIARPMRFPPRLCGRGALRKQVQPGRGESEGVQPDDGVHGAAEEARGPVREDYVARCV